MEHLKKFTIKKFEDFVNEGNVKAPIKCNSCGFVNKSYILGGEPIKKKCDKCGKPFGVVNTIVGNSL